MKKIGSLALVLVVFVVGISGVRAATCETSEMNRLRALANNVNASYEEVYVPIGSDTYTPPDGIPDDLDEEYEALGSVFDTSITNLTEDMYIEVTDSHDKNPKKYYYKDTENGKITFRNNNLTEINKYKIVIYSNKDDCIGQKLRTIEVKTPMYNEYSSTALCNFYPEYYLCHSYVDFELPDYETFFQRVNSYVDSKMKEEEKKKEEENKNKGFLNFIKENKVTVIILSIVIVAAGVGTTVVIVERKRRRVV